MIFHVKICWFVQFRQKKVDVVQSHYNQVELNVQATCDTGKIKGNHVKVRADQVR